MPNKNKNYFQFLTKWDHRSRCTKRIKLKRKTNFMSTSKWLENVTQKIKLSSRLLSHLRAIWKNSRLTRIQILRKWPQVQMKRKERWNFSFINWKPSFRNHYKRKTLFSLKSRSLRVWLTANNNKRSKENYCSWASSEKLTRCKRWWRKSFDYYKIILMIDFIQSFLCSYGIKSSLSILPINNFPDLFNIV